jgi:SAM-dependent methyltransferase
MLKLIYYIKYFFYIALNWNLRLAYFSIYHEIRGERKYRIDSSRLDDLQKLSVKGHYRELAEIYQGASYYLLEKIFQELNRLHAPRDIIDMGCGKGRVLVVAAYHGFTDITGVDFAEDLCKEAVINCGIITKKFPLARWNVLHENAFNYRFKNNDHVFFFFNPFKELVMNQVIKNILLSLNAYPRIIFIVYMNPQHKKLFINANFKEVWHIRRMRYIDAVIFEKSG